MRRRHRSLIASGIILGILLAMGWCLFSLWPTPLQKIPSLHGLTVRQVTAKLGQPDRQSQFPMSAVGSEFRIELRNTYPPDVPGNASVPILELQWDHLTYHVAVWFHRVDGQWVALDTCRWQRGTQF